VPKAVLHCINNSECSAYAILSSYYRIFVSETLENIKGELSEVVDKQRKLELKHENCNV